LEADVEIGLTPHRISEDESWRLRRLAERWLYRAGAQNAEDLASESVLRLLRNLSNGAQIENLDAYVCQVAKNVLREFRRQKSREVELSAAIASTASLNSYPAAELLARCLECCKKQCLSELELVVIEAYYGAGPARKSQHRRELAVRLNLSENAMRLAAFRARRKLYDCIQRCQESERNAK
jgi:RNA polymerase sigma factor (sigma-70 family)